MKLTSLRIEGFQAIRQFELANIPDLAVIAGPNGVGKTTVLDALAVFHEVVGPYWLFTLDRDVVNKSHEYAEIEASFLLAEAELARVAVLHPDLGPVPDPSEPRTSTVRIIERSTQDTSNDLWLTRALRLFEPARGLGFFEYIGAHRQLSRSALRSIDLSGTDPERQKQYRVAGLESKFEALKQQLAASAIGDALHYKDTGQARDSLRPVRDLFDRLFHPKRLLPIEVSARGVRFPVEARDGQITVDDLSAGEQQVFMVFATLLLLDPHHSLLMYDTPELHLNGAIEREIAVELQRFTQRPNQVLATTHSVELMGAVPLDSLFHIRPYDGGNQVSAVSEERDRVELFEGVGASVGLQLISPTVLFLEGEHAGSDKDLLQTLIPDLATTVSLVPSKIAANVEAVGAAAALLEEGTRYSRFYALRDRDYMTDEAVIQLRQQYPRVLVLARYHIENYLLDFEAIAAALVRVGRNRSPEQVRDSLRATAGDLRDQSIAAWARFQIAYRLGGFVVRAGGPNAINVLKDSVAALRRSVDKTFTTAWVDQLVEERRTYLADQWDNDCWVTELPGRELLRRFVGAEADNLDWSAFKALVAHELRDTPARLEPLTAILEPALPPDPTSPATGDRN